MTTPQSRAETDLAPIHRDAAYPLPVFSKLTGLSTASLRSARRKGFKVRTVGCRRYVLGADWLRFLESQND